MNDIEKRIREIIVWYGDKVDAQGWEIPEHLEAIYRLTQLYHQLLSEERQRLIGVVEGMKRYWWNPKLNAQEAATAALSTLLATLNKEKD